MSRSAKKARSDSTIAALDPTLRAEIVRRLGEQNQSYAAVAQWVKAEFGIEVSTAALCNWYCTHGWRESAAQARVFASAVKEQAGAEGDYDAATLALVQERAYLLARAKNSDAGELATLAKIIGDSAKLRLKEREVTLGERRIALLEKKAAQAEAAEGVTRDETLTPAQRETKLKEIFGLK
ncbi:MAG: hypothetical protein RL376_1711 [Verrucomicrobiota bacterium]|jgi:hypothetical protein